MGMTQPIWIRIQSASSEQLTIDINKIEQVGTRRIYFPGRYVQVTDHTAQDIRDILNGDMTISDYYEERKYLT